MNDEQAPEPDPIDEAAAEIDPRSPDAPEEIEELREDADELGRDVGDSPGDAETPSP